MFNEKFTIMSKTKDMVVDQTNANKTKEKVIERLIGLMVETMMCHFKGLIKKSPLWVHRRDAKTTAISIDLYDYDGNGAPVCDELVTYVYENDKVQQWSVFAICLDPLAKFEDMVTLCVDCGDDEDGNIEVIDVKPDRLPVRTLECISDWIEKEARREVSVGEMDSFENRLLARQFIETMCVMDKKDGGDFVKFIGNPKNRHNLWILMDAERREEEENKQ